MLPSLSVLPDPSGDVRGDSNGFAPDGEAVRRRARFALRDALLHVAGNKRQRACGRFPSDPAGVILSRYPLPIPSREAEADGANPSPWRARLRGVRLCDLVWTCPVCGPRIRQERAGDLELAVRRWVERAGLRSALFLTLTVPHDYGEELPDVLADVRAGWSQVIGGRSRQRLKTRYGLRHLVRSHDVTVGRAGWHPHLHAVLLLDAPLDDAAVIRLRGELITSWRLAITACGRRAPTEANGIGLEVVRSLDDIAGYVVQLQADGTPRKKRLALEVTRGDLKRSRHLGQRTPWELLADYSAAPNAGDLHLWRAWEKATKGVHAIQWSRGLRAAVELAPAGGPAPDTVLEDGEETVARFTWDAWRPIAFRMGRLAELLDTAEARGEIGIYRLVRAFARHDASAAGREGPAREMRPHLLAMMRADFAELDRRAYTLELQERERRELQRAELNRWRRRFGYETIPPAEGASPGSGPAPLEPCGSRLASGEADSRE